MNKLKHKQKILKIINNIMLQYIQMVIRIIYVCGLIDKKKNKITIKKQFLDFLKTKMVCIRLELDLSCVIVVLIKNKERKIKLHRINMNNCIK